MEQESLSASESVARSVALKTPKHSEDQLVQEQVDYLRRQGSLQKAQQALLERELEGQALQNQGGAAENLDGLSSDCQVSTVIHGTAVAATS